MTWEVWYRGNKWHDGCWYRGDEDGAKKRLARWQLMVSGKFKLKEVK